MTAFDMPHRRSAGRRQLAVGAPRAADRAALNRALLDWFSRGARDLGVRSTTEPWATLVAEVMSHQTQIGRIERPWRAFLERWPNPTSLAEAPTDELLRAWAGLGYNRRALALREAARRIVAEHGGEVPRDVEVLERLPGVGPYTARAVAASAFGTPVAPLDVNVRRVVTRVHGSDATRPALQAIADRLVSRDDPRRWLHAVMDLAATVCARREPRCAVCPIARFCASAGTLGDPRGRRAQAVPFAHTRRWLRGRIVARLREAPAGAWLEFDQPMGAHAVAEVSAALDGLAADGFVETEGTRARLR